MLSTTIFSSHRRYPTLEWPSKRLNIWSSFFGDMGPLFFVNVGMYKIFSAYRGVMSSRIFGLLNELFLCFFGGWSRSRPCRQCLEGFSSPSMASRSRFLAHFLSFLVPAATDFPFFFLVDHDAVCGKVKKNGRKKNLVVIYDGQGFEMGAKNGRQGMEWD